MTVKLDTVVHHVREDAEIHMPSVQDVYDQILAANAGKYPNVLLLPDYYGHTNWAGELAWLEDNFGGVDGIPIMLEVFSSVGANSDPLMLTTEQIAAVMAVANVKWIRIFEIIGWWKWKKPGVPFPAEYVAGILNFCKTNNLKVFWSEWGAADIPDIATYIAGFKDIVTVGFGTNSADLEPEAGFQYVKDLALTDHWGGSMLAHYTDGNVLTIKKMLRHKSILSTMKYIHTVHFKEEDFEEAVATTPEEIRQLGKAGWQKYDEITFNGIQMHFYRKPKRFGGLK